MLIVANWKMNPSSLTEAYRLVSSLNRIKTNQQIWLAVPSIYFGFLKDKTSLPLGLQNIFPGKIGPFTGEISAYMAKKAGAKFVILGHSERERLGEDDLLVNQKLKSALENNLKVILCFGERSKRFSNFSSSKKIFQILKRQIESRTQGVKNKNQIIFAYEPAWAISTQKQGPAPFDYLRKIVDWFKNNYQASLLYGGSVRAVYLKKILSQELTLEGFLIGSASLEIKKFVKIIKIIDEQKN